MRPEVSQNARWAIEIMTAWASDPDGETDFITERLREVIERRDDVDSFEGALDLVLGFINVTGALLIQREAEMGVRDRQTLRELALQFAGE